MNRIANLGRGAFENCLDVGSCQQRVLGTGFRAACMVVALSLLTGAAPLSLSPPKEPTWRPPKATDVKGQVFAWLDAAKVANPVRDAIVAQWNSISDQSSGAELLDKAAASFALADPNAAKLVELCAKPRAMPSLPSQPWLTDPKTPRLVAENLRLFYGRWLVQNALYEEALDQLATLKPADVVAPAELLFYQGVVYHRLLKRDEGLKAIDQLLDGAEASPRRYVAVARLMQADLSGLEPDTLGHIARRMNDIQRRLDLGRAGPKVRKVEDGVIESLDKLIKKIEDEQKKQQQQAGAGGSTRSTSPAPKSAPLGGRGPGDVTKRNIGSKSGWGDLPPKERDEALQNIGRDFPAHYRDIIEQYFRRLATEENRESKP